MCIKYLRDITNTFFFSILHLNVSCLSISFTLLVFVYFSGERPYKCEQCSATFAYFSSLAAHRKLHSNNKPFICDICNASFFTAYNLRLHSRKHSGERPYQCHLCTESFSWHSGLKCHLKKHQPHTV